MIGVTEQFPPFGMVGVTASNEFADVTLDDFDGRWKVFYFYPKDFTFICPTEIKEMDRIIDEDADVVGFSGDNEFCKLNWKQSNNLIGDIRHILAADTGLYLAEHLGIVDELEGVALRATFIVDPMNVIRSITVNDLDTGRNVDETIRTLNALRAGGLTGCSWNPGDSFVG
jgi:alkyl hydroperoxide reductase subunit AhpC